jgi:hypothetical protein
MYKNLIKLSHHQFHPVHHSIFTATKMPYLFTSLPTNNRQGASDLFLTYKNPNQIPGPVSQSCIIALSTVLPSEAFVYTSNIGTAVSAAILNKTLPVTTQINALTGKALTRGFLEAPDMVTSFEGRELKEKVSSVMNELGYVKHVNGRRQYYKGKASNTAVNTIVRNGGDMDTNAPYGACNIYGFLAFEMVHKLVSAFLTLCEKPPREEVPDTLDLRYKPP